VSAQTNDFQELVAALTEIIGEKCDSPGFLPDGAAGGKPREVDIVAHGEVAGHEVLVGIECRAWTETQDITFVDGMHGKHLYLPTSKLVLVSSSGFSADALKRAEFLNIKAITPGEVTPDFIGEIVNNLQAVLSKQFRLDAEKVSIKFDPPMEHPDGLLDTIADVPLNLNLHRADKTVIGAVGDLAQANLRGFKPDQPAAMKATGNETKFSITHDDPNADGQPVYLMDAAQILRRITRIEIAGKATVHVVEIPLKHGDYDGTPYSTAKVEGDDTLHWVFTEGPEGVQAGVRVLPEGKAKGARFHKAIVPPRPASRDSEAASES
jgi:hypothetical protein